MTDKQMSVFLELHSGLPREAPGSAEASKRAFSCLPDKKNIETILDAGCGPGAQSFVLAEVCNARIISIDLHMPYLHNIGRKITANPFRQIFPIQADMKYLPFKNKCFDLIWSEGAIYNIGFKFGLLNWKSFIKPGGNLVISEICWIKADPPDELNSFWTEAYPDISSIAQNKKTISDCGFELVEKFVLPPEAWLNEYYNPLSKKIETFQIKYHDDQEALEVLEMEKNEIRIFKKYHQFYGYVFFICRLP